jgi:hypothetical protein
LTEFGTFSVCWTGAYFRRVFLAAKFRPKRFERVHGEAGGGDLQAGAGAKRLFQVIAKQDIGVVDQLHGRSL